MASQITSFRIELFTIVNHSFKRRSNKTSKLRTTVLCEGNSPVIGDFSAQSLSDADIFSFDDANLCYVNSTSNSLVVHFARIRGE